VVRGKPARPVLRGRWHGNVPPLPDIFCVDNRNDRREPRAPTRPTLQYRVRPGVSRFSSASDRVVDRGWLLGGCSCVRTVYHGRSFRPPSSERDRVAQPQIATLRRFSKGSPNSQSFRWQWRWSAWLRARISLHQRLTSAPAGSEAACETWSGDLAEGALLSPNGKPGKHPQRAGPCRASPMNTPHDMGALVRTTISQPYANTYSLPSHTSITDEYSGGKKWIRSVWRSLTASSST
jgi:hypothetical protein